MPVLDNSKHEAVAQAFIADPQRSGPAAYRRVYPRSAEHSADTSWGKLLKKAEFSSRIAELEAEFAAKAVSIGIMASQDVLRELSNVGGANLKNYIITGDNTADIVEALRDLSPEHAAAIREIEVDTYIEGHGDDAREVKSLKFKLHSKVPALVALGEHYGLFRRKLEVANAPGESFKTKDVSELSRNDIARRIAFALIAGAAPIASDNEKA